MPQHGSPSIPPGRSWRAAGRVGLLLIIVLACAAPHLGSIRDPSLFDDDLTRVGALRRGTFPGALFRPFNEHLAPLFELVSWLAWWAVGGDVERAATGFLVASFLAWGATLAALAAVVRLEFRSGLAVVAALIGFSLAPVSIETLLWYSASSFQWAAALGLAGWYAAVRATRAATPRRRLGWLGAAALAALASPLCSAIGVLAGPLAALRLLAGGRGTAPGSDRWWPRLGAAAVPGFGTLAYLLLVAARPGHGPAVAASVRDHIHLGAAALAVLRAPAAVLVPGLLGLPPGLAGALSDVAAAAITTTLAIGLVGRAGRGPRRAPTLTALGWVAGGYALAYLARAAPGDRWIFEVGRYHLFPLVGASCGLAAALGPALDRAEARRPLAGWGLAALLAVLAGVVQGPRVADAARRSFRHPEQPRAVAAALRLEQACAAEGVPLAQAIRVVDPTRPSWFPRPLPFNPLLYLFADGQPAQRHPDAEARARVLARLSWDDRAAICGGLDAGRYRDRAADDRAGRAVLRPEVRGEFAPIGEGRLWFAEFAIPAQPGELAAIDVAGLGAGAKVEVWWAEGGQPWWPGRSVRWGASALSGSLDVTRLPHWRPTRGPLRIRIIARNRPLDPEARPTLGVATRR